VGFVNLAASTSSSSGHDPPINLPRCIPRSAHTVKTQPPVPWYEEIRPCRCLRERCPAMPRDALDGDSRFEPPQLCRRWTLDCLCCKSTTPENYGGSQHLRPAALASSRSWSQALTDSSPGQSALRPGSDPDDSSRRRWGSEPLQGDIINYVFQWLFLSSGAQHTPPPAVLRHEGAADHMGHGAWAGARVRWVAGPEGKPRQGHGQPQFAIRRNRRLSAGRALSWLDSLDSSGSYAAATPNGQWPSFFSSRLPRTFRGPLRLLLLESTSISPSYAHSHGSFARLSSCTLAYQPPPAQPCATLHPQCEIVVLDPNYPIARDAARPPPSAPTLGALGMAPRTERFSNSLGPLLLRLWAQ
jgi:hypothetical protein